MSDPDWAEREEALREDYEERISQLQVELEKAKQHAFEHVRPRRIGCKPVADGPPCPQCDCPHTNLVAYETTTMGFMDGPDTHVHDPNLLTFFFECECGNHTFEVGQAYRTCWCGWRRDKVERTGQMFVPIDLAPPAKK